MMARGVRVLVPWGSPAEHDDAQDRAALAGVETGSSTWRMC